MLGIHSIVRQRSAAHPAPAPTSRAVAFVCQRRPGKTHISASSGSFAAPIPPCEHTTACLVAASANARLTLLRTRYGVTDAFPPARLREFKERILTSPRQ